MSLVGRGVIVLEPGGEAEVVLPLGHGRQGKDTEISRPGLLDGLVQVVRALGGEAPGRLVAVVV